MKRTARIKTVYLNSSITLLSQIIQILLGFVIRKLFIVFLEVHYLGYNSVFQNILQMLNLADLGIGVAITSFLYKPLADGNNECVNTLMYMYKRIYKIMGLVVLSVGLIISMFLPILIPDAQCSDLYLRMLFYINLAGTVATYYLAYKRTLLIADQKSYITSVIDTFSYFVMSGFQIAILIIFPNYILYLIIGIAKNILSNILISIRCNKEYGSLTKKVDTQLLNDYKPQIINYVKNVFVSRIGAFIFYSTDSIIISIFRGSIITGYLSNYTMITTQITNVVNQILAAVQATFGNYISVNDDNEKQKSMTDNYLCVNFCIGNFCMICIMFLIQPFIEIVFGSKYVLAFSTVSWLSMNLMLTVLIQLPSQIFIVYKLHLYDRPIIIASAIINIVVSTALVIEFGIDGVLIGTFITSLLYLFSRFYIIARYAYQIPYRYYVFKIFRYGIVSVISVLATNLWSLNISGMTIASFGIRMIFIGFSAIIVPSACLVSTSEFHYLLNKMTPRTLKRYTEKRIIYIMTVLFVLLGIIVNTVGKEIYRSPSYSPEVGNKSILRTDKYVNENINGKRVFHLSLDDFIYAFKDLTENSHVYDSIFENDTFLWLKKLHDKYGIVVSCYVYYEDGTFTLDECTTKFYEEFVENSDWLRFGFHTLNSETTYENSSDSREISLDYVTTIACLSKIVGEQSIDNVIRLQSFSGSIENIKSIVELDEQPIIGLLTADDFRVSYYLDDEKSKYIYSHDKIWDDNLNIYLYSTDLRIEFIDSVQQKIMEFAEDYWNNQLQILVVFTHEWVLDKNAMSKTEALCKYAQENNYEFIFLEDIE